MQLDVTELTDRLSHLVDRDDMVSVLEARPNFWDVLLYDNRYEILYSRTLTWLMNPRQTHGLGTWFAEQVLALAGYAGKLSHDRTHVQPEWRHIDILLHDDGNDVVLAIENKTVTGEHVRGGTKISQLDAYHRLLLGQEVVVLDRQGRERIVHDDTHAAVTHKHFLFLTPDGAEPLSTTDSRQDWKAVSYADLEPALEGVIERATRNGDFHTRKIVEDLYFKQKRDFQLGRVLRPEIRSWFDSDSLVASITLAASHFDLVQDALVTADDDVDSVAEPDHGDADEFAQRLMESLRTRLGRDLPEKHLRAAVAYVWESRPMTTKTDHTKDAEVQAKMAEFVQRLTGQDATTWTDVRDRYGDVLTEVRLSGAGGGQSAELRDVFGTRIWVGGSAKSRSAPTVMHHRYQDNPGCELNSADFREPLKRVFENEGGAALAEAVVTALRTYVVETESDRCGCGAPLIRNEDPGARG